MAWAVAATSSASHPCLADVAPSPSGPILHIAGARPPLLQGGTHERVSELPVLRKALEPLVLDVEVGVIDREGTTRVWILVLATGPQVASPLAFAWTDRLLVADEGFHRIADVWCSELELVLVIELGVVPGLELVPQPVANDRLARVGWWVRLAVVGLIGVVLNGSSRC